MAKLVGVFLMCMVVLAAVHIHKAEAGVEEDFKECYSSCHRDCFQDGNGHGHGYTFCEMKCDADCSVNQIKTSISGLSP